MDTSLPPPSGPDYAGAGGYPIGVVATLTGLPVDVIRAWERRYGVPRPARTAGGHRLYSPRDVALLRRAAALRAEGHATATACAQARVEAAGPATVPPVDPVVLPGATSLRERLCGAALNLDTRHV